jgi:hypothetical protein
MVLGLPPDAQERVLVAANENRWTVKALQSAIAREKATRIERGGRRPQTQIFKGLKTLKKCIEEQLDVLRELEASSQDEIAQSLELMAETSAHLDSLSQLLRLALRRCDVGPALMMDRQLGAGVGK